MTRGLIILLGLVGTLSAGCVTRVYSRADVVYVEEDEPVVFVDSPDLVYVEPGVYVVRNHGYAVYYIDGYYYSYRGGRWYHTSHWSSPWVHVHVGYVPGHLHHRHHHHYVHYRGHAGAKVIRDSRPRRHAAHASHDRHASKPQKSSKPQKQGAKPQKHDAKPQRYEAKQQVGAKPMKSTKKSRRDVEMEARVEGSTKVKANEKPSSRPDHVMRADTGGPTVSADAEASGAASTKKNTKTKNKGKPAPSKASKPKRSTRSPRP